MVCVYSGVPLSESSGSIIISWVLSSSSLIFLSLIYNLLRRILGIEGTFEEGLINVHQLFFLLSSHRRYYVRCSLRYYLRDNLILFVLLLLLKSLFPGL
jgi:hypothetical protein